ncbi:hypothetical protein [Kribbella sp. CA-294648]|uniref:hypothetical protein n=1 Tax=Kribbella sp. CA-294648 TaxID=3239948 RepID=UPI003D8F2C92
MRWGKVASVGVVGCLVVSLAGCGPRRSPASVGVTVDDAGKPVLVLRDCDAHITRIKVSHRPPNLPRTVVPPSVKYNASDPAEGVVQFSLLTGGSGWQLSGELPQAAGEYSVQLWGDNWAARGTEFTFSDLKLLKPGLIRHQAATAGTAVEPGPDDKISTTEQFSTPACD